MKIAFCIDDTDNIGTPGTGHLATDIQEEIHRRNWGHCTAISRHQLFVHKDVPFTSHNSAMCFEAAINTDRFDDIIQLGTVFLESGSAEGSDPGLCVAVLDDQLDRNCLIAFGLRAKNSVLTKHEAYRLAKKTGVHLTEHGGTGMGVIGALAGVGLRCSGNDGRLRGWHAIAQPGDRLSVSDICSHDFVDSVRLPSGERLPDDRLVQISEERLKLVWQDHERVMLVMESESINGSDHRVFQTLTKQIIKQY